jgi:hypothetical protein
VNCILTVSASSVTSGSNSIAFALVACACTRLGLSGDRRFSSTAKLYRAFNSWIACTSSTGESGHGAPVEMAEPPMYGGIEARNATVTSRGAP